MIEIRIDAKIFKDHPTFRRGIVIARNLDNQGHSPELEDKLRRAIRLAAEHPIDLKTDPLATAWNDAHRQFGSNPNKFPPAHCALLKRVQKPGARMPFINKVVALMNIDGLGENSEARTIATRDRVARMLENYCQAEVMTTVLSPEQPVFAFET